jgi:hypothetical protein
MEPFCRKTRSPSFTAITFALALPQTMDAGHDELAVFGLVIEVGHLAIVTRWTPWASSQVCKGRTRESYWL